MPGQGNIWIGERILSWKDAYAKLAKLGIDIHSLPDLTPGADLWEVKDKIQDRLAALKPIALNWKGKAFLIQRELMVDYEVGVELDLEIAKNGTLAMIGFSLTERYTPAILDSVGGPKGNQPFALNLEDLQDLLKQARTQWTDAGLWLVDQWY